MGRIIKTTADLKPSPDVNLTKKVGSKIVGTIKRRFPSELYPGKFSYLIAAEFTDSSTTIYDKETQTRSEVDIEAGDTVFLKGTAILDRALGQVKDGEKVEIVYTGLGTAKKGQKAPFMFDVTVL